MGTPLAKGRKNERRRAATRRSLLATHDDLTGDGASDNVVDTSPSAGGGMVASPRRLLQDDPNSTDYNDEVLECATPFFPDGVDNYYAPTNLLVAFYDAVDLWSPDGMAALCAAEVGRCRSTVSKPVLKAPMVSALEAAI